MSEKCIPENHCSLLKLKIENLCILPHLHELQKKDISKEDKIAKI